MLLNNSTQYFGEAYVGLAWNSIYKANTIQGLANWNSREYQRDISNQYFILADEYVSSDELCPNDNCSQLCQNLLAGQAYNSSYQALESSRKFYDYGLDSSNWIDMVNYSDSTIYYSDKLLDGCSLMAPYIFDHDTLINQNTIRVLRAQTYVRLGDFDNAELEFLLSGLECDLNSNTIIECLNLFYSAE